MDITVNNNGIRIELPNGSPLIGLFKTQHAIITKSRISKIAIYTINEVEGVELAEQNEDDWFIPFAYVNTVNGEAVTSNVDLFNKVVNPLTGL